MKNNFETEGALSMGLGEIMDQANNEKSTTEKPVVKQAETAKTGAAEKIDRRLSERERAKRYLDTLPHEKLADMLLDAVVANPEMEAEIRRQVKEFADQHNGADSSDKRAA